jgi:hypothetical protein
MLFDRRDNTYFVVLAPNDMAMARNVLTIDHQSKRVGNAHGTWNVKGGPSL